MCVCCQKGTKKKKELICLLITGPNLGLETVSQRKGKHTIYPSAATVMNKRPEREICDNNPPHPPPPPSPSAEIATSHTLFNTVTCEDVAWDGISARYAAPVTRNGVTTFSEMHIRCSAAASIFPGKPVKCVLTRAASVCMSVCVYS